MWWGCGVCVTSQAGVVVLAAIWCGVWYRCGLVFRVRGCTPLGGVLGVGWALCADCALGPEVLPFWCLVCRREGGTLCLCAIGCDWALVYCVGDSGLCIRWGVCLGQCRGGYVSAA
eukprot:6476676-Amphidinium_carterae.4